MKFEKVLKESSMGSDSYNPGPVRDFIHSWAAGSKKLDPMNPDYKEKFKGVDYGHRSSKDDPEIWKHYKKFFMPKDSEKDV